jgi:hypothetical protein
MMLLLRLISVILWLIIVRSIEKARFSPCLVIIRLVGLVFRLFLCLVRILRIGCILCCILVLSV